MISRSSGPESKHGINLSKLYWQKLASFLFSYLVIINYLKKTTGNQMNTSIGLSSYVKRRTGAGGCDRRQVTCVQQGQDIHTWSFGVHEQRL